MSIVGSIITMLLILSVLTIIHELGHYLAARAFKVKVNEFAVFMGPKIFSRVGKKSGTRFSLRCIPIGGFCAMEGEEESSDSPTSYNNKPWYIRAAILFAGPFMNLILALTVVVILFCVSGYSTNRLGTVSTESGYLVTETDIAVGDKIVAYDGKRVFNYMDYSLFNLMDQDNITVLTVKKTDGTIREYTFDRTPAEGQEEKALLGISFESIRGGNVFKMLGNSVLYLVSMVRQIFYALFWLITGQVGLSALAGPVGLTTVVNDVVTAPVSILPKVLSLLEFSALISVNLGIFNLLPFPGLDGGRLLLAFIEFLRRGKRISPEKEAIISFVGLALLMLLAVVVMGSDIFKIVKS